MIQAFLEDNFNMGNDKSTLRHLEIDKKCVETNDCWTLFNAQTDDRPLSVFIGENVVQGQLWITQTPIERSIKNLMIYRHPFILKYIASWDQHLATERVQPLATILQTQTDIQICLGLRNILCALIFLVEQAKARHLNISIPSIYVSSEGEWRLGGFEHVWKSKDLTRSILELANSHRYKPCIDPNETSKFSQHQPADGLEQYAFATLCEEILKTNKNSNTPYVVEFRDYCAAHLKHQNVALRPKLSAVLLHPYFNHEFILIHSFLTELPLKSPQEKQDFFTNLIDRLKYFDENVVATQIGNLLLSRMVLLDSTAEDCVTPFVLKPKSENNISSLYSSATYSNHIIPRIKKIFCVRDSQIRLILLDYFTEYIQLMTEEELRNEILPNLLLGIKDTNDVLVAKTLRCLADLIPILGASVVIGGNRGKLFADGRPQDIRTPTTVKKLNKTEPRSITPVLNSAGLVSDFLENSLPECNESFVSPLLLGDDPITVHDSEILKNASLVDDNEVATVISNQFMPERLSPDGGEDEEIQAAVNHNENNSSIQEDGDDSAWSDWDNENENETANYLNSDNIENEIEKIESDNNSAIPFTEFSENKINSADIENINIQRTKAQIVTDDINDLDIKIKKLSKKDQSDEFDFFKDMEPVIKSNISVVEANEIDLINNQTNEKNQNEIIEIKHLTDVVIDNSRFELKSTDDTVESGWDDDDVTVNWNE
ncbi:protein-associating with the carboxyl-terminal domain of ezrin [Condylostylus longicornis]|uniref:protein-associating with the carboxyl-terminal domain of ezrin n=1 Tax=Condylostylus longicornis TaxID=2530218 RepID=UPI00244E38A5|nr:protein-associating with the carboxyl-terminal domain of ezrin [Condylostylus longicornis]